STSAKTTDGSVVIITNVEEERLSALFLGEICYGFNCKLELKGMVIEEGTDSGADPEFLMELMEINEALDEVKTPEEANKIGQHTKGKLAVLTEEIDAALLK
ncbi:hypothetical protein KUCAC02_028151, partial [Chaenocephalus aceratus]